MYRRVRLNPVAHPARIVVQQIRRHDLRVVPRRVRERALPVAIAERPDPRHARSQLVVHDDVAAVVSRDAGLVEPEVVGVGTAADREQHVRPADVGAPSRHSVGGDDVAGRAWTG